MITAMPFRYLRFTHFKQAAGKMQTLIIRVSDDIWKVRRNDLKKVYTLHTIFFDRENLFKSAGLPFPPCLFM